MTTITKKRKAGGELNQLEERRVGAKNTKRGELWETLRVGCDQGAVDAALRLGEREEEEEMKKAQ